MAEMLIKLYGNEYDGYIQPFKIASCWMNEFVPEICIFNMKKKQNNYNSSLIKQNAGKHFKGGKIDTQDNVWIHKMNDTILDDNYKKNYNIRSKIILLSYGYKINEINEDIHGFINLPLNISKKNNKIELFVQEYIA